MRSQIIILFLEILLIRETYVAEVIMGSRISSGFNHHGCVCAGGGFVYRKIS